jgi:hypothetical protein
MKKSIEQRLKDNCTIDLITGCWNWNHPGTNGYGMIRYDNIRYGAHVLSFIVFKGPISDGLLIRHSCDNRKCINPSHLIDGTYLDNSIDRDLRGRCARQDGENNGNAKFTWIEVNEIRQKYAELKIPMWKLSAEYGKSCEAIRQIINGITWRSDETR